MVLHKTRTLDRIFSEGDGVSREDGDRGYTEAEATVEETILHPVDALPSIVVGRRIRDLG